MRDLERWKDKVELSLDGRQIFFLFFGTAVAVCLIFVAGVLVGKRLEARALALTPPPVEDPLAALDQLGEADDADDSLTYHKALTHEAARNNQAKVGEAKSVDAPKAIELAANLAEAPKPADAMPKPPAPKLADAKPAPKAADAKPAPKAADAKPAPKAADAKPAPKAADAKPAPKAADAKPAPKAADAETANADDAEVAVELPRLPKAASPLPAGKPQVVAAVPGAAVPGAGAVKKADAQHFTLQLSAFPERQDAEEFMRKIQSAGYKPFLVVSEIPGKGVFYRVRVGDFATRDSATNAKAEFERKQRLIAYVAKL